MANGSNQQWGLTVLRVIVASNLWEALRSFSASSRAGQQRLIGLSHPRCAETLRIRVSRSCRDAGRNGHSLTRNSDARNRHHSGRSCGAGSARGISPRASHRSGREPLDSSGSCHPEKAAAFHQDKEFLRFPVDSTPTWVACPLRSTGITPLPRYYKAVRPWSVHRYFRPRGFSACAFSLRITDPVLKFRTKARIRVMPPIHRTPAWPVSR
jgi:hypothetical protein